MSSFDKCSVKFLTLMVLGAWKVFVLVLVILGVLEGATEWGINNKIVKIVLLHYAAV